MATIYDYDIPKEKRPEGSRNFPLVFPSPVDVHPDSDKTALGGGSAKECSGHGRTTSNHNIPGKQYISISLEQLSKTKFINNDGQQLEASLPMAKPYHGWMQTTLSTRPRTLFNVPSQTQTVRIRPRQTLLR